MYKKEVEFEGVIVGFESPPGFEYRKAVYLQGSYDGESASFYVLIPDDMYERFISMGVGRMINGRGSIISMEPIIIDASIVQGG
ncbi:MAG: hypothetical protein DRO40_00145 [Thermoprotei archaeon]|nr:MAG: hypothetical protein DRO40_00145 [Thermoprotei archaeon]